jgi:hypothetical protein
MYVYLHILRAHAKFRANEYFSWPPKIDKKNAAKKLILVLPPTTNTCLYYDVSRH